MSDSIARMPERKRIALVAHDDRKHDLVEWCKFNRDRLSQHVLFGTGTTAAILQRVLDLDVHAFYSGPLGGDQQLGAKIVQSEIDVLIFFWDPLGTHPHDPDVRALLRVATMQNIPVAPNRSTADFIFSSPLVDIAYERHVYDYADRLKRERVLEQIDIPGE